MGALGIITVVLVFLSAGVSSSRSGLDSYEVVGDVIPRAEEKVELFWNAFNAAVHAGDEEALAELYAPSARIDAPGVPSIVGTAGEEFKELVKGLFKLNKTHHVTPTSLLQLKNKHVKASNDPKEWYLLANNNVSLGDEDENKVMLGSAVTLFQWVPSPFASNSFWSNLAGSFLPWFNANDIPQPGTLKLRWQLMNKEKNDAAPSPDSEPDALEESPIAVSVEPLNDPPIAVTMEKLLTQRWAAFHTALVEKNERFLESFFTEDCTVMAPGVAPVTGIKDVLEALAGHMGASALREAPERKFNELLLTNGHKKTRTARGKVKVNHFILEESALVLGGRAGKQVAVWELQKKKSTAENDISWGKFTPRLSTMAWNFDSNSDKPSPAPAPESPESPTAKPTEAPAPESPPSDPPTEEPTSAPEPTPEAPAPAPETSFDEAIAESVQIAAQ